MSEVLRRATAIELSGDRRFAGRVRRLALTATVALGLIWALAVTTLDAPRVIGFALAAGWLSMPTILLASLGRPLLRYALVLPSTLVGLPLLAISAAWLPSNAVAASGWLLMTAGILMGGMLGLWFWYRLIPVPPQMDDPFSSGRLALIGAHVALIVTGLLFAALPLLSR
ncbi:MAG: hypothetical protein ABIZ57_02180 [Candidatus Limnocylindria bacterium]